ncbi:MAG: hypothetical protein KGL39_48810 [Patescibacteria group bacterium]|nr:hypothetical protein [Patescibacteria group bacterium]
MLAVLLLFLIPVGGGIPAGVLLGKTRGLSWEVVAGLYFVSDVILALAFEPVLRGFVLLARRVPFLARVGAAMKESMARTAATFTPGAGPIALIMIAFGVDPMTGRSAALAAGHGFVGGWTLAITGDMLYYGVIAVSTLRLNRIIKNPNTTMWIILGAMFLLPMLVRRLREGFARRRGAEA